MAEHVVGLTKKRDGDGKPLKTKSLEKKMRSKALKTNHLTDFLLSYFNWKNPGKKCTTFYAGYLNARSSTNKQNKRNWSSLLQYVVGVIGTPPTASGEFQYHKCGICKICLKFSISRVAGSV
jgi:hypothetical protein